MDIGNERFCYVTTKGRITGKPHRIEIWFIARDQTLYMLMGSGDRSDTVRNLRADPNVRVEVGELNTSGKGRVVDDATEAAYVKEQLPRKYAAEEAGLEEWARTALPVAIDLCLP